LLIQWIPESIPYTGKELHSLWIYRNFRLQGNALIAFQGPCEVQTEHLVDQEDALAHAFIYSPLMLHFIGEFFHLSLKEGVFLQRWFMALIREEWEKERPEWRCVRKGDDLYVGNRKLSVSIVTASPISVLLHTGLNIKTQNTQVPTFGLEEAQIHPESFAQKILKAFDEEYRSMEMASCKVKWVF
jgi:hypothetical protein